MLPTCWFASSQRHRYSADLTSVAGSPRAQGASGVLQYASVSCFWFHGFSSGGYKLESPRQYLVEGQHLLMPRSTDAQ